MFLRKIGIELQFDRDVMQAGSTARQKLCCYNVDQSSALIIAAGPQIPKQFSLAAPQAPHSQCVSRSSPFAIRFSPDCRCPKMPSRQRIPRVRRETRTRLLRCTICCGDCRHKPVTLLAKSEKRKAKSESEYEKRRAKSEERRAKSEERPSHDRRHRHRYRGS